MAASRPALSLPPDEIHSGPSPSQQPYEHCAKRRTPRAHPDCGANSGVSIIHKQKFGDLWEGRQEVPGASRLGSPLMGVCTKPTSSASGIKIAAPSADVDSAGCRATGLPPSSSASLGAEWGSGKLCWPEHPSVGRVAVPGRALAKTHPMPGRERNAREGAHQGNPQCYGEWTMLSGAPQCWGHLPGATDQ